VSFCWISFLLNVIRWNAVLLCVILFNAGITYFILLGAIHFVVSVSVILLLFIRLSVVQPNVVAPFNERIFDKFRYADPVMSLTYRLIRPKTDAIKLLVDTLSP